jgi:hypothetical protein
MAFPRPLAAALLAMTAIAGACQGLVGIEDSPPLKADAGSGGDASVGGAAGAGGGGGSSGSAGGGGASGSGGAAGADAGCGSARPPIATAGADTGGSIDLTVAVRTVELGDDDSSGSPTWPNLGYDLDKLCTCGTDTVGGCMPPKKVMCDGVDGRDNALGALLYQIKTLFNVTSFSSAALNQKIEGGGNTVLIRVQGYNGTSDDGEVDVAWLASDDFDVTNANPPVWDGSDVWPVLSSSLEPQADAEGGTIYDVNLPKYVDHKGFVAGGTLVATLPQGSFALTTQTSINFTAALFTAKLTNTSNGWAMSDGLLSGVTKVGDVLGTLPSTNDPLLKQPICTDNLIYPGIKNMICEYPDMTLLGTPAASCDHLSFGAGLTAVPAKLGSVVDKPPKPSPCAAGKDPKNDSC